MYFMTDISLGVDLCVDFFITILVVLEWQITLIPLQLIRPLGTFLFLVAQFLGRREVPAGEGLQEFGTLR